MKNNNKTNMKNALESIHFAQSLYLEELRPGMTKEQFERFKLGLELFDDLFEYLSCYLDDNVNLTEPKTKTKK